MIIEKVDETVHGDVARSWRLFHAPLHSELANQLEIYAASQNVKPETVIAEAVRHYLGMDA